MEIRCGTRNPPMGLSGFGELRSGEGKGGGGLVHGGATPNGVLGSGRAYVPHKLAQKNLEGARVLTGASGGRRRRADGSPAGFGGGNGAVAVDGVVRGSSGTADSPGRHEWTLRRWYMGQRSSEVDGGAELCGRRVSPGMASGLNPASAPAEIASRDLEESPGVGAKLGRSSGGAWARRSGGAAAAQILCVAERGGGGAARVRGGGAGEDGV